MTRGPDGASPGPRVRAPIEDPAGGDAPDPSPPPRPTPVEFASVVLIVGGVFRLFAIALALNAPPEAGLAVSPPIVALETAIQVLTIVVGALARFGRSWLLVVNVVAILAFIQLISLAGAVSLAFGLLFAVAFVALFLARPGFEAMGEWRARTPAAGARLRR